MKAVKVSSFVSDPLLLAIEDIPSPSPDRERYLIEIHAWGVNFFDLLQVQGRYQEKRPFPWVAGTEFAGVILAVPTTRRGASSGLEPSFKVGDRVFGSCRGAFATHILAPGASILHIPEDWSFRDAATLYVSLPTAYAALVTRGNVRLGEWVLIHAGAGATGLAAIQIAKSLGATVIATAGSPRKFQICCEYGADYVVDYQADDWPQQVVGLCEMHREGNGRKGVDVVLDPVGLVEKSLKCMAWNGRLVVVGFAGGKIERVAVNRVLLKNVSIVGLHWGPYEEYEPDTVPAVWEEINRLIRQKKIRGIGFSDRQFRGLESIPWALREMGTRRTWGKVVAELHMPEQAVQSIL